MARTDPRRRHPSILRTGALGRTRLICWSTFPPGTSDAPLTVLQSLAVDGVVLVTMPQSLATMIVRKAANLVHQLKKPIVGVVENMSYFEAPDTHKRYDVFGPSYAQKVSELAGAPLLAQIPLKPVVDRTHRSRPGRRDR